MSLVKRRRLVQHLLGPRITTPEAIETFWTPEQIADCTDSWAYVGYIGANWLTIARWCDHFGIWDRDNAAAIAGTIAIETAHSFVPVMESFYLFGGPTDYDVVACDAYNKAHTRYYPWYGKGLMQSTWEDEYIRLENESGMPFHDDPMIALQLVPASYAAGSFWVYKNIAPYARAHDWTEVRRRVQGGASGLGELTRYTTALLAL